MHRDAMLEFLQAVKFYLEEQRFEKLQDLPLNNQLQNDFLTAPFIVLLRNILLVKGNPIMKQTKVAAVQHEANDVFKKMSKLMANRRESITGERPSQPTGASETLDKERPAPSSYESSPFKPYVTTFHSHLRAAGALPAEPTLREDSNIRESIYVPKAKPNEAAVRLEATRVKKKKQTSTPRAAQVDLSLPFGSHARKKQEKKTGTTNAVK